MSAIDERIAAIEGQLKQAKAKKRLIEARQRVLTSKKQRAEETRRKILVGAAVLAKVDSGEWPQDKLNAMMDRALSRTDDRALFGLLPRQADSEKPAGQSEG